MPVIIDPVFAETSQNARFLLCENERFGLVFVKTGSINSGTGLYLYITMSFACCLEQLHEQSADGEQAELDKDGTYGGVHLRQLHSRQPRRLEPTGEVVSSISSDIGLDKSAHLKVVSNGTGGGV